MTHSPPPSDANALARHAGFVRAVAHATLHGDDAVEDVVQDTWVAALRSGPRDPRLLKAWLAGIARRLSAGRLRRLAMRRRRERLLDRPGTGDSTLDLAIRVETGRQVADAVLRLDEPYRRAVLLRYYEDLPPREIARREGVPVETVRTWVKRGLERLRTRLERDHGERGQDWRAVLLPLLHAPEPLSATVAAVLVGGSLAMKKAVLIVVAMVLVAAGVWIGWPSTGPVGETRPGSPPPDERAVVPDTVAPAPRLAGRAEPSVPASPPATWSEAPYRGRVVDLADAPMAGIRLGARTYWFRTPRGYKPQHAATGEAALLEVVSDGEGRFAFPEAPWEAPADMPGPSAGLEVICLDDHFVPAGITIERGVEANLRLVRGGRLGVRVIEPGGEPAARANVRVLGETRVEEALLSAGRFDARDRHADDEGRVGFVLPPGRYRVQTRVSGRGFARSEPLGIVVGARVDAVLTLTEGIVLSVLVRGPGGEAVAGAHVELKERKSVGAEADTDGDGRCRIAGIEPPDLADPPRLSVIHYRAGAEGYAVTVGEQWLPRGAEAVDLEIRLPLGFPVGLRVVDEASQPLPDVTAHLTGIGDPWNNLGMEPLRYSSDASGRIGLPRLTMGWYSVRLAPRATDLAEETIQLSVTDGPVEREVVLLRRGTRLTGIVRLPDGEPATRGQVAAARSQVGSPWEPVGGSKDIGADGTFELDVGSGHHAVVASVPGFTPQWREVDVVPGGSRQDLEIRLERRGRIAGQVVTWDDEPVASARIFLGVDTPLGTARQTTSFSVTETGTDGRFTVDGVGDGEYPFSVHCLGWTSAWPMPASVRAGDENLLAVLKPATEGPGMPVLARITAGGLPYRGQIHVAATDLGGSSRGAYESRGREDGLHDVRVRAGPPGRYHLRFLAPGWLPFEVRDVEVRHRPPPAEVDVTLARGAVLEVRVTDGTGHPLAGRWIDVSAGVNGGRMRTDDRGILEIGGFEPGVLDRLSFRPREDTVYTWAQFRSVDVPGTLDVVLRPCGFVVVTTPSAFASTVHDVVFQAIDGAGRVVDESVLPSEDLRGMREPVGVALRIYEDGTYRVEVHAGDRRAGAEVEARVGETVRVTVE